MYVGMCDSTTYFELDPKVKMRCMLDYKSGGFVENMLNDSKAFLVGDKILKS